MFSKEEKKEIDNKMSSSIEDYMRKEILQSEQPSVENLSLVFTYKMTANLVKNSRVLTIWTIVIAVFTIILGASTIWSIIDKYLCQ